MLARQAAAAVGVGMCWLWETAATLPSVRRREALRRPRGSRGAEHIVAAARLQHCHYHNAVLLFVIALLASSEIGQSSRQHVQRQ